MIIIFKTIFENVKKKKPLVHNITNYVTANDCANILIACGACPIMADAVDEVEDITEMSDALNINIGTLNRQIADSMIAAGKRANKLNHPVILDPVGISASKFRTETVFNLLKKINFSVIKGNISEIKAIASGFNKTKGVDADATDQITKKNLDEIARFAKAFSKKFGVITAITSTIDIVADYKTAYCIYNGDFMMSHVTGTGCQLSAMTAAFVSANKKFCLEATAAAVCAMGIAGQIAKKKLGPQKGNLSYKNNIIDTIYCLTADKLEKEALYEIK